MIVVRLGSCGDRHSMMLRSQVQLPESKMLQLVIRVFQSLMEFVAYFCRQEEAGPVDRKTGSQMCVVSTDFQ